jgi:acyl-CoA synthetase (NDP forming)
VALLGTNDRYVACARAVLADPGTTHMLWVLSSLANRYDELGGPLLHLAAEAREQGKRLLLTYLSPSDPLPASQEAVLRAAGVPVYPYPEQAVAALGRLRRTDYPAPPAGMHEPLPTRTPGASPPWTRIEHLLRQAGISLPRSSVVHSPEEAEAAAAQLGTPVALKVLAPTLAHKTEAGAVRLGLSSPDAVPAAAEELLTPLPAHVREGGIEGLLVQEMILGGLEIIIGATWDLEFGPILTIGAGGVLTELLGDSVVLGLPVVEEEVRHALRSTRIARLLGGFRGAPPADEEALVRCALGLAELYARESWIGEIELNPVAVLPHGAVALDALVVPARSEQAHGTAG